MIALSQIVTERKSRTQFALRTALKTNLQTQNSTTDEASKLKTLAGPDGNFAAKCNPQRTQTTGRARQFLESQIRFLPWGPLMASLPGNGLVVDQVFALLCSVPVPKLSARFRLTSRSSTAEVQKSESVNFPGAEVLRLETNTAFPCN
jgi:hypothetical protein